MAYISQETKKELAPAIKAVAKKYGVKVTIGVNHHSSLVVRIKEGVLDFIGAANAHNKVVAQRRGYGDQEFSVSDNFSINPYHDERHWTDVGFETEAKFVAEMVAAMKGTKWYDNSDAMTDYFDTAYYLDLNVGRWDTPYVYTA